MVGIQREGGGISVNPAEVIAADMRALPEAARKALRPKLRAAADGMVSTAKVNAGWSKRIPATIRTRVSFRADRESVDIIAGNSKTPHARVYEGITGKASFRHPVYPRQGTRRPSWTWREEATRPYLVPAVEAGAEAGAQKLMTALDEAARELGFGG